MFSISLRRFRFSADLRPLCLAVKIVTIDNISSASSPDLVSSTLMSEPSTMIFVSYLTKIHSTSSKAKRQSQSYFFYKCIYVCVFDYLFLFIYPFLISKYLLYIRYRIQSVTTWCPDTRNLSLVVPPFQCFR